MPPQCCASNESACTPSPIDVEEACVVKDLFPTEKDTHSPGFPLFPCSKGFQLTMKKTLKQYRAMLQKIGIPESL